MGSGQAGYRCVSAQVLAKVFEDGFGILGMFGGAILNAPPDIGVCHVFDHVDREFPAGYTGCGSDDWGRFDLVAILPALRYKPLIVGTGLFGSIAERSNVAIDSLGELVISAGPAKPGRSVQFVLLFSLLGIRTQVECDAIGVDSVLARSMQR